MIKRIYKIQKILTSKITSFLSKKLKISQCRMLKKILIST